MSSSPIALAAWTCLIVAVGAMSTDQSVGDAPTDADRAAVVRAAVARVAPSIVTIETIGGVQPVEPAPGTQPARRRGGTEFRIADGPTSGLIYSADGMIVSSSFNFARDPSVITVVLADGRRFVGRLLARDSIRRLALLRIDAADLPAAEWADPAGVQVGQYAMACGRGFGGAVPSVSVGIVSALRRRSGHAIQTDAKLSPANYGGPLIDIDGRVLGICVPLAGGGGELAGVEWYDSGIGFAIPRAGVEAAVPRLARGENIEPGRVGVLLEMKAPESEEEGEAAPRVQIVGVADPSPARDAGLRPGDAILALDGAAVGDVPELQRRLSDVEAGTVITLTIERAGQSMDVKVKLAAARNIGSFPQPPPVGPPTTQPERPPPS